MEILYKLTIHAEWQWRKRNPFRAARTENAARGRFLLKRIWSRMCFGETQRCRRPSTREAVTGRQTGDHLGNTKKPVGCLELQSTCRWSRCVWGRSRWGEGTPLHGGPRPKASVVLPLLGKYCCQVCVLRECNRKRHFNHNFFWLITIFKKALAHRHTKTEECNF